MESGGSGNCAPNLLRRRLICWAITVRNALTGLALVLFFSTCTTAQTEQSSVSYAQSPLKIRVILPPDISTDDVWLAYGLYTPGHIGRYIGIRGPVARHHPFPVPPSNGQGYVVRPNNSPAFYEIDGFVGGKRVERFQALLWAPGCKMVYFDVPDVTGDLEEHFTCTKVGEITVTGRLRGVNLATSPGTVWVSYDAGIADCFQMHTCDKGCAISCPNSTIFDIASGAVAADGRFKVTLPNFSDDQLMSHGGLVFSVGEQLEPHHVLLRPESGDMGNNLGDLKIAPFYPGDLTFVPNEKLKW